MDDKARRIAGLSLKKQQALSRLLREKSGNKSFDLPRLESHPAQRYDPFPLSVVQRVYYVGRSGLFDLGSCGANVYTEIEADGMTDLFLERLNPAIQKLIARHDMLRAFVLPTGQQQVLAQVPFYEATVVDLRGSEPQAAEAELVRVRHRMRTERAAIDHWPLFEFLVHLLDGDKLRLHVRIEALLVDGTSRGIMIGELFRLISNPETPLPPIECSYRDYVLTWEKFKTHDLYQRSRDYWLHRASSRTIECPLPLAKPLTPSTPSRFTTRSITLLETSAWAQLKVRCNRASLTPTAVIVAAFADVLRTWSQTAAFSFSLVGSYRPAIHPHINHVLGNFNTVHLLMVEPLSGTFAERAKQTQDQIASDLEHQYFSGFELLSELNRRAGNCSRVAMPILFNSGLEYSHFGKQQAQSTGQKPNPSSPLAREIDGTLYMPQVLLLPTVIETGDECLVCKVQAVEEVFPPSLLKDVFDAYSRLLNELATTEASWNNTETEPRPVEQVEKWRRLNETDGEVRRCLPHELRDEQAQAAGEREALKAALNSDDHLQEQIRRIWSELLGVAAVEPGSNFFELGGDSFLVVRLVQRTQEMFGKTFPLLRFYQNATVEGLASLLEG